MQGAVIACGFVFSPLSLRPFLEFFFLCVVDFADNHRRRSLGAQRLSIPLRSWSVCVQQCLVFFVPFAQAAGATIIVRLVTSFVGKRIALLGDSVAVGCHDVHVPQLRFFILKAAAMRAYFRVGEMGLEGVGEVLVLYVLYIVAGSLCTPHVDEIVHRYRLLGGLQLKAPGLCRLVRGRI